MNNNIITQERQTRNKLLSIQKQCENIFNNLSSINLNEIQLRFKYDNRDILSIIELAYNTVTIIIENIGFKINIQLYRITEINDKQKIVYYPNIYPEALQVDKQSESLCFSLYQTCTEILSEIQKQTEKKKIENMRQYLVK